MTIPCPQCGGFCQPMGQLDVAGDRYDVYKCMTCTVEADLLGRRIVRPVLWAVGADGVPRHADTMIPAQTRPEPPPLRPPPPPPAERA